jgi:transcriptional regulator with XRE-family HTH domain
MTHAEFTAALRTLGWSQAELCRRLGLHRNTASKWRETVPKYVAEYLRVSLLLKEGLR